MKNKFSTSDFNALKILAESGNIDFQFQLGICLYKGYGTKVDYKQALNWFRKAAEQGNNEASFYIGLCYEYGKGVEQNYEEALYWYDRSEDIDDDYSEKHFFDVFSKIQEPFDDIKNKKIEDITKKAEDGDAYYQYIFGLCYLTGNKVKHDINEAIYWLEKAGDQDYLNAQIQLGKLFIEEVYKKNDIEKSIYWLSKAAKQGNAKAQYELGFIYGTYGSVKNDDMQVYWLTKSAEQENINAYNCLGLCYWNGVGVEKNEQKALELLTKAANKGDSIAQHNLGFFYDGGSSFERDEEQAHFWYMKSVMNDKTNLRFQISLAEWYFEQEDEESYKKAIYWLLKVAQSDFSYDPNNKIGEAQYKLAHCYFNGIGVTEDNKVALTWLQKSAKNNYSLAIKELNQNTYTKIL